MPLLARPHYYCAKFMTVTCKQTRPSRSERALLFTSFTKGTLIWEQNGKCIEKWSEICFQKTNLGTICYIHREQLGTKRVPHYQVGNNVFNSQRGTRNKTVLNEQSGNNVFHLQRGTRNKTVLIYQFGNNVFHLQIGTRNKTVLNEQFRNNVFHLQIGTRNKKGPTLSI